MYEITINIYKKKKNQISEYRPRNKKKLSPELNVFIFNKN